MKPESPDVHQDPEQVGPDPRSEDEAAGSDAAAIATLEDRLRRALADLDNLRKRYARELDRERAAAANRVAAAWLPVLDNLDLALGHADADPSTIIEGVRAVRDQALAVLADLGFSRYDEVGVPFDPARHEVVNVVDDAEAEPGTVVRVLRPGYGTAERQLRPGAVTVAGRRG
jgi:molecular chaperone GrpE